MNEQTHELYTKAAIRVVLTSGGALEAASYLATPVERAELIASSSLPDRMNDVACGGDPVRLGHNMASCTHFPHGYCWNRDTSLSIGGFLVGKLADIARARVTINKTGMPAPLAGLLELSPMELAIAGHPSDSLGSFPFPTSGQMAEFYGAAARNWIERYGSATGLRVCGGCALHMVQDSGEPHHVLGQLLNGHQQFEDQLEILNLRDHRYLLETGMFGTTLTLKVREVLRFLTARSLSELCEENAEWSARYFRDADLSECKDDQAFALLVQSIAVTVLAINIMTK